MEEVGLFWIPVRGLEYVMCRWREDGLQSSFGVAFSLLAPHSSTLAWKIPRTE